MTKSRPKVPDTIGVLIEYLTQQLTDIPDELAGVRVLAERPSDEGLTPFVVLVNVGGPGQSNHLIFTESIVVDSYAGSRESAMVLARLVDEAMHGLTRSSNRVTGVASTAPSEFPDPDVDLSRATATYELMSRMRKE